MATVSLEQLRGIFDYSAETGVFTNRVKRSATAMPGELAGRTNANGYIYICINYRQYLAHRLAWFYVHGYWPTNDIDHIDGNRANNRIANLREATRSQNLGNSGLLASNTSGCRGVSWAKRDKRWEAYITIKNRKKGLGYYKTRDEAQAAYQEAAKVHFGEFARLA